MIYASLTNLREGGFLPADKVPAADADFEYAFRIASDRVADATRNDRYATSETGLPVMALKREAMRDATCIQVAEWIRLDVQPNSGLSSISAGATAASINGASITFTPGEQSERQQAAAMGAPLCADAWMALRRAGMASAVVGS